MAAIYPTGVTADRNERVLLITWNDGRESRYPFAGLRAVCPCVECKGGHANMGQPPDLEQLRTATNPDLNLEQVQSVGSYALQFMWSDGHYTGIYTWEYLRQADPGERETGE
ncbi:MAG: DUF971 domain-containing protein [Anaerolineae bacterium]|nr:DUF971 domain-containing protein [Anaerolineae bacterium]